MIDFRATFDDRAKEISDFLALMRFLEALENERRDEVTSFEHFFSSADVGVELSYQSVINTMKSNISLMIYNIIEFSVSNLVEAIYHAIQADQLTYTCVNNDIRKLWRKARLKSVNDPNASFNTFIRKNEEIIDFILQDRIITLQAKNSLPSGNLDGQGIVSSFNAHGLFINTESCNYRPDVFTGIKEQRNRLAHGSVSFVEALRDETIDEIAQKKDFVVLFLEEVIGDVSAYINDQKYRLQASDMG